MLRTTPPSAPTTSTRTSSGELPWATNEARACLPMKYPRAGLADTSLMPAPSPDSTSVSETILSSCGDSALVPMLSTTCGLPVSASSGTIASTEVAVTFWAAEPTRPPPSWLKRTSPT
jgi:hypothetical protein